MLRVVAVGDKVTHYKVGDRVLVQADWKHMKTPSNGSFGYAFEGALQEYVVVDERIVWRDGEDFLIRVSEGPTAAQVGLIEPWATVQARTRGRNANARLAARCSSSRTPARPCRRWPTDPRPGPWCWSGRTPRPSASRVLSRPWPT